MNTPVSASIAQPRPDRPQARPVVSAFPHPRLLLFVFVGLLGLVPMVAHAQTATTTASTTTEEDFESPPKCEVIGSTRQEISTSQQVQGGSACIGIGNRDVPNGSPACGGLPAGSPDPYFGSTHLVADGVVNTNTNTHTLTLTCVEGTPALPLPWLTGLGLGVLGAGAALLRRLRGGATAGVASA